MSGRTIRTRAAASTGGKMPKALANKKATPAQAKGTNRSSGGKGSTQARKAAATSANKATPAGRKGKAEMAMAADSEADEDSDEVPLQTDSDEAFGEAGADNASDNDSAPENVMVISSDDDQSTRPEVELTPKIARRRSTGSSPPSTPKTPSPVKRGRGGAAKAKATPGKRAKESDSDEEIDEGISPLKKAKKASTPVQARIPLPRRQTIAAMIAAEKAELAQKADKKAVLPQKVDKKALPQKKDKAVQTTAFPSKPTVEVLLTSRKASAKAMSSKKAVGTAKAPDSAAEYFMDETDDEDKY